jgi:hypothetical protein
MDFFFMGGSMGSVVGEKVARAAELATERRLPLLIVTASGGARMQEGTYALMQLPKTLAAIARLKGAIKARAKNIKTDVGPDVEIETCTEFGPVLCVRPFCHNDHDWQVFFDTNKVIREELAAFPAAARPLAVRNVT